MRNKKILLIFLTLGLLFSCSQKGTSSSSSIASVISSENTSSIISSSSIMEDFSLSLFNTSSESNTQSSSQKDSSISKENSSSSTSSLQEQNFSQDDLITCLASAAQKEYSSVSVSNYRYKKNSFSKQIYTMNSYLNDILIINGASYANNNTYFSRYKEQRMYNDSIYTSIKKFDSTFENSAIKKNITREEANYYLNINLATNVYLIIEQFLTSYSLTYKGTIDENKLKHASYFFADENADDYGNVFCAIIDIEIDKDNYLTDFFYSEAYYDSYYVMDGIDSLRKHGGTVSGDGYSYEMTDYNKTPRINYENELIFPIEDNFVSCISFIQDELIIKLNEIVPDEYNRKSIYLLDYIMTNPTFSLTGTAGCPINNVLFTSSDNNIASIGDRYYLDIIQLGTVIVQVSDSCNNVNGTNSLKVIIE